MRLIDTNIIMYALGKPHALKENCRNILQDVVNNTIEANIDTEVLQELLYVYSFRGEREKGFKVVEEMLVLFPNPFSIRINEIEKAKDLMKVYSFLTARDAIHCAVTINNKSEGLISTDKDLKSIKEIYLFKP